MRGTKFLLPVVMILAGFAGCGGAASCPSCDACRADGGCASTALDASNGTPVFSMILSMETPG